MTNVQDRMMWMCMTCTMCGRCFCACQRGDLSVMQE